MPKNIDVSEDGQSADGKFYDLLPTLSFLDLN